jgi:hypothetical protein
MANSREKLMISLEALIARIKGMTPTKAVLKPEGYKILCEMGRIIQEEAPKLTDGERRKLADLWEETVGFIFDESVTCIRVIRTRESYVLTLKALKGDFPPRITDFSPVEDNTGAFVFLRPAKAAANMGHGMVEVLSSF